MVYYIICCLDDIALVCLSSFMFCILISICPLCEAKITDVMKGAILKKVIIITNIYLEHKLEFRLHTCTSLHRFSLCVYIYNSYSQYPPAQFQ